ncbi:hypothetical protein BHU72_00855 [Desulfuribacillus stibiiarsenatis]|uniref:Uncharacterized protein n=1 Tax=Desulfuribacillus stibiiarsenatis TaxID=1390249 RepID=A0A1E5L9L0_9FIRM|nr:hypothetical protein [Desulfuribacillus stibiiarsenatis]OEH86847.1 hypothetical protein BHU72_00855 [Desulfuribacillus stibiiarsenatis]
MHNSIGRSAEWLSEGVSVYEANQFRNPKDFNYIRENQFSTLSELSDTNNTKEYDLGYVVVEFIQVTWGIDALNNLIKSGGNVSATLKISTQEFEKEWNQYIREKYLKS